jgi:hypothetical protein
MQVFKVRISCVEDDAAGAVRISLSFCFEHMRALWIVLRAAVGFTGGVAQRNLVRRMRQQIAASSPIEFEVTRIAKRH